MNITLFTQDEKCTMIDSFQCSHITMFEKDFSVKLRFLNVMEETRFIICCTKHMIPIKVIGCIVTILINEGSSQTVRYRFD